MLALEVLEATVIGLKALATVIGLRVPGAKSVAPEVLGAKSVAAEVLGAQTVAPEVTFAPIGGNARPRG